MSTFSNKQLFLLTRDGKTMAQSKIPPTYLETEGEWIEKVLIREDRYDGLAFVVDWDKQTLTFLRHAD